MTIQTLAQAVGRPYPGRGIVLGMLKAGAALIGYFIMGRSENSRNRVFLREGEGIRTRAFDPARLSDPSLVIYTPMRRLGEPDEIAPLALHLASRASSYTTGAIIRVDGGITRRV